MERSGRETMTVLCEGLKLTLGFLEINSLIGDPLLLHFALNMSLFAEKVSFLRPKFRTPYSFL